MANQLLVTLQAVATVTATQTGDSVDIETRTAGVLSIEVDAVTGTGHEIILETSPDESAWREVFRRKIAGPLLQQKAVSGLQRYVRARIVVNGVGSLLVSVELEAHQIYCDRHSLTRMGLPDHSIESVSDEEILELCLSVTDECDSYIGGAYLLPLLQWGRDLRLHATKMLARYLLDKRGWDPEGADVSIALGHTQAITWLDRVAKGTLKPAGIIDSSPTVVDSGSVVVSRPRRESFA